MALDSVLEDSFYAPLTNSSVNDQHFYSHVYSSIIGAPVASFFTIAIVLVSINLIIRYLRDNATGTGSNKQGRSIWMLPYTIPFVGHALQFLLDPAKLMAKGRDISPHEGIFALSMGAQTFNVVIDPKLVKGVMQKKESEVQFEPIAWNIMVKFFGAPAYALPKYEKLWKQFANLTGYLLKDPHLSNMLNVVMSRLQENISQMISFMDGEIDQQPWERFADATYISDAETEINLMALMRDMMGHASIPALFGRGLLDTFPDLLHDLYDMDAGMVYFIMGLPAWTPWPSVAKAHMARKRVWRAVDSFHRAMDAKADNKPYDFSWGDLDDVSELFAARHKLFKDNGFEVKERGDVSMIWALTVNANLLVYWLLLHILNTPGLTDRIRAEIAPYAKVSKPVTIGNFSEPPKLTLLHEGLAKHCPLFKSAYLEALRTCNQPWSIRQVGPNDVQLAPSKDENDPAYVFRKKEHIFMPHDLHMRDPKYFKDADKFDPERFIVQDENGQLSTDMGTIRPYGGGPMMCKGRVFAERECMALVAGVLVMWDIEPADKKVGFVIPKQKKTSAVSLPVHDTRVRIRRRKFEWDERERDSLA